MQTRRLNPVLIASIPLILFALLLLWPTRFHQQEGDRVIGIAVINSHMFQSQQMPNGPGLLDEDFSFAYAFRHLRLAAYYYFVSEGNEIAAAGYGGVKVHKNQLDFSDDAISLDAVLSVYLENFSGGLTIGLIHLDDYGLLSIRAQIGLGFGYPVGQMQLTSRQVIDNEHMSIYVTVNAYNVCCEGWK